MPAPARLFNQRIPLRDGVCLAADVVVPADSPAPAVLLRTPYGRSGEAPSVRAAEFAGSGYAAVWVDVRGRGDSDGVFEPYRNDGLDGVDVIDWVAHQPWCSGDVVTYGGSYPGQIQWLTALHHPAALRAMAVLVCPSDPFVEDPTGVPSPMHLHWHRMTDGRVVQYTGNVDWLAAYGHRPRETADEAAGFRSDNWREEGRHPTLDGWWEPRRYQHRVGEVDVPVLHVSGWYDDEEIGTPANYAALVAAGRVGQRLVMGPWGHRLNAERKIGDIDFGADAVVDLTSTIVGFFDEHVRGKPTVPAPSAVRIFVMGVNEWRDESSWPPVGTGPRAWYLRSAGRAASRFGDGRLTSESPPPDEPPDTWVHDPDRPVPFITDVSSAQIGGPDDYSGVETRGDVLVYTSEPFAQPLDVLGPVRLIAHVATSAADADITAKLLDVHPGGFAQRLCDGLVRLRFRDGHADTLRVEPGEIYGVEVVMWDTAQRFLPGHRLRLEVASSAFPKFTPNLGTAGDMWTESQGVVATNTVWHDAARPSRLVLTVREVASER